MIRPWPIVHVEQRLATSIFNISGRRATSPRTGEAHEFVVLEAPAWVNVVPLTDDGQVVLVRQYRQGRERISLEVPGGMVDPEDADPAAAARRELLEETGLWAGGLEPLGQISPNPAIQDNLCHSFLATSLERRGEPALDGSEDLEVLQVPLAEIPAMIARGEIEHALVVVAFWHLQQRLRCF